MRRILIILLTVLGIGIAYAEPKLIVTIAVEDMDVAYLKKFSHEFTQGGFKKLMSGEMLEKVEFDYNTTDYATDIATLFTSSNPCFHGIVGERVFSRKDMKMVASLLDKKSKGLNDNLQLSGEKLLSTTYADWFNEEYYGMAKILSIATNPTTAMLMAGHSGMPIYMNNLTGEWSTSNYYKNQMPKWLTEYNKTQPAEQYMSKSWSNIQPAGYYVMAARKGSVGFNYSIGGTCNGKKKYDNFATIPYCNDYICDLALKAAEGEKLGKTYVTDLLMVNFSLKKFFLKPTDKNTIELEDAYIRLDRTIMRLVENLENRVGKENIVIVLISSRTGECVNTGINAKIKYESFNIDKYTALLNSYLMAFYGQKRWVLMCRDGNIYLNHSEIEKAELKLSDVQDKAKEFFYLIPGVQNLCSAEKMEEAFFTTGTLRYAYYRGLSGDLLYSLMPRWYEVDLKENPTGYVSSYKTSIPAWIYGSGQGKENIKTVKATELFNLLK